MTDARSSHDARERQPGSTESHSATMDSLGPTATRFLHAEPAPALPTSEAPLAYTEHTTEADAPPASTTAVDPPAYHVPVNRKSLPINILDPEGVDRVSRSFQEEARKHAHESTKKDDLEAPPPKPPSSADPFDENARFDLGAFLKYQNEVLRERNHELPSMGLAFQDLNVTGYGSGAKLNTSVGSMMLTPLHFVPLLREMIKPHVKHILNGVTGCVKPGEMLLVLGRPGSGCTTLLKSLASYRDGYRTIDGKVSYEGFDHKVIDNILRGEVVYAPEDDEHFPTLMVKDTLRFAAASRAPRGDYRVTFAEKDSRRAFTKLTREAIATILGLRHTYNTVVGDSMLRGVSGGERKRVSIGEVLAARAKIVMFDNSSRGLDASTALEFVEALRIATDINGLTTISSMYQAGESITQTFDKVVVMNRGYCVYYGPVSSAMDYFKSIGFQPLDRQTTSDFLVACTDPVAQNVNPDFEYVPRSAKDMADAFNNSEYGRANRKEVEEYMAELDSKHAESRKEYVSVTRDQRAKHVSKRSMYMLSMPQQVRLAIKRRAQISWGDRQTAIIMSCAVVFQAIIMGSVFFQMDDSSQALFSRSGVMFFALLYNSFAAMAEIPNNYRQRPIVIRHKRFAMLRPAADSLANVLLDIPSRFVPIMFFNIVLYFMSGLSYRADKFFIFFFLTLLITYTMVTFFNAISAFFHSMALSTMIAGLVIIDCALYAGFAIPRPSMVVWWRWLSYCNPISFGFEILLANEFRDKDITCAQMIPPYPNASVENQVCPIEGGQPGKYHIDALAYLDNKYGYSWDNTDRNVGIIIAFYVFCILAYMVASEFQSDPSSLGGVMVFKRGKVDNKILKEYADDPEDAIIEQEEARRARGEDEKEHEHDTGALEVSDEVFSWRHVCYDVQIKDQTRRLLDDVSGYVAPGKMTALMGESGAGKTTLLNVLAQRTDVGVVTGDFTVNGRILPKSFQADTGYCQQQDVHLAQHTVREALQFSAMLRQPRETPKEERLAYVETVIELLEMEQFADAIVGDVGQGLNVEQRKRLTIGVELAAKPSLLLFLDEPTSGLDAQAAWSVVRFLKKLASEGQAILCTIHQPSGELFNQFDRLLLLQKGGRTAYFGDLGPNSMTLIRYFEERSGVKCGENDNPAEYILDMIGAGATATTDKNWFQLYRESPQYAEMQSELDRLSRLATEAPLSAEASSRLNREYAQPFFVQVCEVVRRAFASYWRNPTYVIAKLFLNAFGGLFIGSSFWGQGAKTSTASLQNKLFATFMSLVLSTSLSQQLQPEFIDQRSLFEVRERPSKMYSWVVFLIAQAVVEIPWNFLGGTLFWIPWYYMVQFGRESTRAGYSWGFYMLFQLYYSSFAQAVATISPNAMIASMLFATLFSFVIVFCGVVQPPPQLPYFWRKWMFRLSPFTWIVEGMMGNVIHDQPVQCEPKEFNVLYPPSGMSCDDYLGDFSWTFDKAPPESRTGYYEQGPNGTCRYCVMRHGEDYLQSILLDSSHRYRDIGFIIAYIAFNYGLYIFLYYIFRVHKWRMPKISRTKATPQTKSETEGSSNMPDTIESEKQVPPERS